MKRLGVFLLPPGWDCSPTQGYTQQYDGGVSHTTKTVRAMSCNVPIFLRFIKSCFFFFSFVEQNSKNIDYFMEVALARAVLSQLLTYQKTNM